MRELAELLTCPAARDVLGRRDVAAVFGILREAGVSQARIARATGQREPEVSEILSGRKVQSVTVLERIADGLGVPRAWMGLAFSDRPYPEPVPKRRALAEPRVRRYLIWQASILLAPAWGGIAGPPLAPLRLRE